MKKRSFVLSITEELRNKVKADATMKSISMNAWITEAVKEKLERDL
jgi:predicted HicB family RNase H-like nuclease